MSRRVLAIAALAAAATGALAGPLDPPPGPVSPTMKTLVEVEPRIAIGPEATPGDAESQYRITQSGSYYLTGNITGEADKSAIVVTASNVTIDLGGFTLRGIPGSRFRIETPEARDSVVIRNGIIRNFGESGIYLLGTDAVVEDVQSHANGDDGFRLTTIAVVRNCIARDNVGAGFSIPSGLAESCIAMDNGSVGISIGYTTAGESLIRDCYARNNYHGFTLGGTTTATRCTATYNEVHGFNGGVRNFLERCTATFNGQVGIKISASCRVRECHAASNKASGIEVIQGQCVLQENSCRYNGRTLPGAGILVRGAGSRLEANQVEDNSYGIQVTGSGNLIIRNSATGSVTGNYNVASGNSFGPLVTRFNISTNDSPHGNYDF